MRPRSPCQTRGMARTPAVEVLIEASVRHVLHEYEVDRHVGRGYGEAVAEALGVSPVRLFKTLVVEVDGGPAVGVVPAGQQLSLKAMARAAGGKRAVMAAPGVAERLTGYVTGGISPLGQRRRLPTYVDESVLGFDTVYVSAGRRGLQVELDPRDLIGLLGAEVAPLATR